MMLTTPYPSEFPGLRPGITGLAAATSSTPQLVAPATGSVGTWDRIGSSSGNCYNTVSGLQVPCYCVLTPWLDVCNPTGALPTSVTVPPVAPQTYNQMTTPGAWTPNDASAWTTYVQGQVNAAQDSARSQSSDALMLSATNPGSGSGSGSGTPSASDTTTLVLLAAAAAGVLVLLLKK